MCSSLFSLYEEQDGPVLAWRLTAPAALPPSFVVLTKRALDQTPFATQITLLSSNGRLNYLAF